MPPAETARPIKRKRRRKKKPGEILRIPLGDEEYGYLQVLNDGHVSAIDYRGPTTDPAEIGHAGRLFRVCVYDEALKIEEWISLGSTDIPADLMTEPYKFKQDKITGRLAIYHSEYKDTNYERPATLSECLGLECAAVWAANHVQDRLKDHFAGVENKSVRSLSIDIDRVPGDQRD